MINKRIIPVLLLRGHGLVKTREFAAPIYLGDAINTVSIFNQKMVDELIILDIDATADGRSPNFEMIERLASQCFMPLAYGGGISTLDEAARLFRLGVEKIVLNSSALEHGDLVQEVSAVYGKQSVVVAIDVVKDGESRKLRRPHDGAILRISPTAHALWAQEAGAGEVLVQDVTRDGTRQGYDIELFKSISSILDVPLIALGGAADAEDLTRVIDEGGASAAAAGSLFVFAGRKRAVLISMPEFHSNEDNWRTDQSDANDTTSVHYTPRPNKRICALTVLDDSDPNFETDHEGVALLARKGQAMLKNNRLTGDFGRQKIAQIAKRAKAEGKSKDYDCVIGLSGGVDSTYVAMMVKELGLRPLALHLDNGWNSNTAVLNIKRIVDILDIDLHTYVINWADMRDLQRAFFRASLPDVELLTDHAIVAATFQVAAVHGIKTVITGVNVTTESIMPEAWSYSKRDAAHIRAVHRKFGEHKLTNFPMIEPWELTYYQRVMGIRYESLLSYIEFDKKRAICELKEKLGYEPYPRKHGESRFTQFFQEYYLPQKFGFDKRKGHFSSLIVAGQMNRDEALRELETPLYTNLLRQEQDIEYVCRKLGFSAQEWNDIMSAHPASHDDFPGYYTRLKQFRALRRSMPF
ncbi:N-acetyl sugar amidotransferase [Kordiimonas lacus]|uniref:Imidazole glycerol phosphate synthase subunit HisF n=1 Tax=Kordiimonas lacus TaxID=637679 RepID=A0A1G6TBP3_9PROT|nr:N-acetyl sugar amidotransferase [Kordiimonas lacus]SDD26508.1 imidazoleglycerol phosphate synthase, cyclase subunit [Kordiimonas lacus]